MVFFWVFSLCSTCYDFSEEGTTSIFNVTDFSLREQESVALKMREVPSTETPERTYTARRKKTEQKTVNLTSNFVKTEKLHIVLCPSGNV
jgi:hypothetical protein